MSSSEPKNARARTPDELRQRTAAAKQSQQPPTGGASSWSVEHFQTQLKRLSPSCETPPTDGHERRKLYAELELLRLDYEEFVESTSALKPPSASSDPTSAATAPPAAPVADPLLDEFNRLRGLLALRPKRVKSPMMVARMIAGIMYVLAFVPIFYISVPLRPFHILLRKFGIRNNYLPLDLLHRGFCKGLLRVGGVSIRVDGYEHLDRRNPTIVMFTHASSIDVIAATAACPIACKFVAKKQLFYFPVIGWLLGLVGHVSIDRGNLTKAKRSLEKAVEKIHRWGRSIAISPEGTRSKSGLITDFKKGPFHLALQVNLPITPIIITNAFELWPHGQLWSEPGVVDVHFMPRISIDKDDTVQGLSRKVHRAFLQGSVLRPAPTARVMGSTFTNLLALFLFYAGLFGLLALIFL